MTTQLANLTPHELLLVSVLGGARMRPAIQRELDWRARSWPRRPARRLSARAYPRGGCYCIRQAAA